VLRREENTMRASLKEKIIDVCNKKINDKGPDVGLSFYAFFANKNDNPPLLMEAAEWWIMTHQLDHFEKAIKIKKMVQEMG
jgi:hypothetical protein